MRKTVKVSTMVESEVAIQCDVCKKTFNWDNKEEWIEAQECISIVHHGGYGSVFGDPSVVKLDICQHCLNEKLGEYLRYEEALV
jgi:hypothetical protein